MNNRSIFSLTFHELENFLVENNKKKFIVKQIFDWIYKKFVYSFDEMTNLSKDNIKFLKDNFYFDNLELVKLQEDKNDETKKALFKLSDGNKIETVVMKFPYGYSICVTTQVGCNMGCNFCASGQLKKKRNLEVNEIILQIITMQKILSKNQDIKINRIVVMGIGEPFDNFDNLLKFIDISKDRKALEIGSRHITVSTCGLVPKIIEWSNLQMQVNLAISLHAPNNEIRNKIMPINNVYNIEKLMESIDYYLLKNNRRVTIEYILIKNINDSKKNAIELADLLRGKLVYVNIIPYNSISNSFYKRSDNSRMFYNTLLNEKITCTIRKEKGTSIDAACGQLRAKEEKNI